MLTVHTLLSSQIHERQVEQLTPSSAARLVGYLVVCLRNSPRELPRHDVDACYSGRFVTSSSGHPEINRRVARCWLLSLSVFSAIFSFLSRTREREREERDAIIVRWTSTSIWGKFRKFRVNDVICRKFCEKSSKLNRKFSLFKVTSFSRHWHISPRKSSFWINRDCGNVNFVMISATTKNLQTILLHDISKAFYSLLENRIMLPNSGRALPIDSSDWKKGEKSSL